VGSDWRLLPVRAEAIERAKAAINPFIQRAFIDPAADLSAMPVGRY